MNKNIRNIFIEKKRIIFNKTKYLYISKSILQNNNINNNIRFYIWYALNAKLKNLNYISRRNKICLYTGKIGGILKYFSLSRHTTKKLIIQNKCTNISKINW